MPTKKKPISKALKIAVWNKTFGEDIGKAKCKCCEITDITQLKFHCGHIKAESNGGETCIDNLLPICESCNKSMGKKNLNEFKKTLISVKETPLISERKEDVKEKNDKKKTTVIFGKYKEKLKINL